MQQKCVTLYSVTRGDETESESELWSARHDCGSHCEHVGVEYIQDDLQPACNVM